MIGENALVIYKGKPALTKELSDGKISISLADGTQVKVREKDIEQIHPGPVKDFSFLSSGGVKEGAVREAWELLLEEGEGSPVPLKELAALICGEYSPAGAYAAYFSLMNSYFFSGKIDEIVPRSREKVIGEETKREEKQRESIGRAEFLERLKACLKNPSQNKPLEDDSRFIQDIEALAFGKSGKSRTMRDIGLGETPEDAHSLLLRTGLWTEMVNPHPVRFGVSLNSPNIRPVPPPDEERIDLTHLRSFAIDSPWSIDPDDAVSIETGKEGETVLYVHIADPASSISFDSPEEKEARDRGATVYLPEGAIRMLADEALSLFALGLSEKSPALTFKMTLDKDCGSLDTEIFPSLVKVRRISYEDADKEIDSDSEDSASLRALYEMAQRNYKRRTMMGSVNIELPDTHVSIKDGIVNVQQLPQYRSATLVRECMIVAGESAGNWAASKGLAFPYISQEAEIPPSVFSGYAGSIQLRKSMRPRVLSTRPGRHQGLGLDTYTQVTSPLRRYTDLLAHIQIRNFLRKEKTLTNDEVSARLGYSEAAAYAAVQTERASNNHWTLVYLLDKKDSQWDAVALEKKVNRWAVLIPSLAMETQVPLQRDVSPNDEVKLVLKSVNIAKGEAVFMQSNFS